MTWIDADGAMLRWLYTLLFLPACYMYVQGGLLESLGESIPAEFCHNEVFQALCGENEVIVMQTAIYGRMRIGKCVEMDLGYLGCKADVLLLADSMCSGQRKCDIGVPHKDFDQLEPCLKELKSYLEASYACVPVKAVKPERCSEVDTVNLTSTEGVISSATSVWTLCGTRDHPWLIMAQPGQRINITLYDFAVEREYHSAPYSAHDLVTVCKEYGFAEEYEMESDHVVPICGGTHRVSHVLLSEGHAVKLWLEHMRVKKKMDHFLIEYEVLGCPDITPSENTWFKRVDGGAEMGCVFTDTRWKMECDGHVWVGTQGNCSKPHHEEISNSGKDKLAITYGKAIAIILGAAFGVGFLIVIIGLVRYRRRRSQNRHSCSRETMLLRPKPATTAEELEMSKPSTSHQCQPGQQPCMMTAEEAAKANYMLAQAARQSRPLKINGNEYEHIWESPLPTPRGSNTLPRRGHPHPSSPCTSGGQPSVYTKYKTEKQPREKPLYVTARDIVAVKDGAFDLGRYSSLDRGARRDDPQK